MPFCVRSRGAVFAALIAVIVSSLPGGATRRLKISITGCTSRARRTALQRELIMESHSEELDATGNSGSQQADSAFGPGVVCKPLARRPQLEDHPHDAGARGSVDAWIEPAGPAVRGANTQDRQNRT